MVTRGSSMNVNDKLRFLRIKNNISQKVLANMLNMTISAYNRKELGSRAFTISEAGKLARFFNTTIEELFLK